MEQRDRDPRWQDVFASMPDLLVAARPRALRQDKLYGPLLRGVIELGRRQSRVVEVTALEAIEDADELLGGIWASTPNHVDSSVLVVRGVRTDLDPAGLVDADGHTLWREGPPGAVRELERTSTEPGQRDSSATSASLFELPGRTWVVASGEARVKAREVFLRPLHRPDIEIDPETLAVLRIRGPSLVARVDPLHGSSRLASIGRHLAWVLFELPSGKDPSIRATFDYSDESAAVLAEATLREVRDAIGALARTEATAYAWLGAATLTRSDGRIIASAPLPEALVASLVRAGRDPSSLRLSPVEGH